MNLRSSILLLLTLMTVALSTGCRRKHIKVSSVPELGYPTCNGVVPTEKTLIGQGELRSNPNALETDVVESFQIERRGCLHVGTTRQAWHISIADVEVVFDENWLPLRAWKRLTIPGVMRADGLADTRRYEFRTPEVTIKHRKSDGSMEYEILRGPRPRAVIAPGHGLLTAWIQKAHLNVGEKIREPVIDFREPVEVIRDVTLRRDPDLYRAWAGRNVRVYTIYGRETVFTDENNVVIGDLAGLQPDATLSTPRPPPLPSYGAPDPVNTP